MTTMTVARDRSMPLVCGVVWETPAFARSRVRARVDAFWWCARACGCGGGVRRTYSAGREARMRAGRIARAGEGRAGTKDDARRAMDGWMEREDERLTIRVCFFVS